MQSLPLHFIPVPGARPLKTHALDNALNDVPPGMFPALLTETDARPSYGLVAFLKAANVAWVRPAVDGQTVEGAFGSPSDRSAPLLSGSTTVAGSVVHPANQATRIGNYTTRMLEEFQARPLRAGAIEPLEWRWDTGVLTDWFQQHMPSSALIFSGEAMTGLLTVSRTDAGIVESFDALISTGNPVSEALRDSAVQQAVDLHSLNFSIEHHFGADALGVFPGGDRHRVPLVTVLGPGMTTGMSPEPQPIDGVHLAVLGSRPFQHLAVRFPLGQTWDAGHGQVLLRSALSAFRTTASSAG